MYRVLITDDEKIEREGIKFLLAQEEGEYEIHEAANGRQALNVLRSEEIDFLLTDIKMPHMDGLELASKVREEYPNLPIVIFTRNLLDEENCRKHGNEAAFQQLSLFGDEMGSRRLYTENTKNHVDRKVGAI